MTSFPETLLVDAQNTIIVRSVLKRDLEQFTERMGSSEQEVLAYECKQAATF